MRTLSSILFAVLATLSVATHAAVPASASLPQSDTTQPASAMVKVNLNTADAETLRRELSGIGATKAQAIVTHRDTNGAFTSVDEMLEVNGIGKSLLDRNIDKLTIE
ncbi:ComEA family DNA-binding protein [Pseudomonas sp. HR96]|uniref:ComEA family DNA-binding protein n=1 Tax=Pseudomonas sp. HR96 TaxID=1027966 RepID=UPI0039BDF4E4